MKTSSVTALLLLASSASADSIRVDRSRIWAQVQAAGGERRDKRDRQKDMKECDVSPDTDVSDSSSDSDVYTFKLNRIDAHCIDEDGERYQYGEFKDVEEYYDCAKKCVEDTDSDLLEDLVGFEWDCDDEKCRCLYDEDALNDDNDSSFDEVETGDSYDGEGPVKKKEGGEEDNDWFCAKLKKDSDDDSSSSTDRDSRECVDEDKVTAERDGNKYKIKLFYEEGQCADKDGELYEYGQFKHVDDFSDCAEACIKDVDKELVDEIRGIDWDCAENKCRCLYDKGTLDSGNDDEFDKTDTSEKGEGSVKGGKKKDDWYCGKVKEESDVDVESERALRGSR